MADYGLAAQIGRGNAMGGQQPDPTNRMMQMMQMQQLQQNMLLARDAEARQRQLFPLTLEEKRADIRGAGARADTAGTVSKTAEIELEQRRREQETQRGVLDVFDRVNKGELDLRNPQSLRSITNPAVRLAVEGQLAQAGKIASEAQKANLEMGGVNRAQVYDLLSRSSNGITGPREFNAYRNAIIKVSPEAADFLPNYYNPSTAQALRDFVADRKTTMEMIGNVPYMRTPGSPVLQEMTVSRASEFGGTPTAPSTNAVTPEMMASIVAGTSSDLGATQGAFGQRLPAAGEAGFTPIRPAQPQTMPASQMVQQQEVAKLAAEKAKALPKVQNAYKGAIDAVDKELRAIEEIKSRPFGTAMTTGPIFGRLPNITPFDLTGSAGAQSRIDTLKSGATLNALTELRRNSPTGAALSSTSDADIKLLTSSTGALSEVQSTEDFMAAIANRERDLLLTKRRLSEAYQSDYGAPPKVEGGPLAKMPVRSSDVSVLLPNNATINFPSKAAADAFMKKAGQ